MNSIINAMPKYDHRQHVLSDWLAELDQRFQLGDVDEDTNKIMRCQLLIGAIGSGILSSLDEATSREEAKETLLTRLDIGSVRDKAWVTLKNLKKGTKDIVELSGEAEKLAKRLHPRDEEAAKRHAVDAFLGALEKTLAAEVQKLGHRTMKDVVAAAWRIEKILEEQSDSKVERLISTMQDQIRLLKKDLREANDQIAAHKANAQTADAMAAVPAPTPIAATAAQAPAATSARHIYQDYGEEPKFYRPTAVRWIVAHHVVSYVEKKGTSYPTVLPAQSFNASSANKHVPISRAPPRGQILELPTSEDDPHPNFNVHLNC